MKLLDILEVADENHNIIVRNQNGRFLDFYDGKNSIDEKYNNNKVLNVRAATPEDNAKLRIVGYGIVITIEEA